jgi:hypothetical protein
MSELVPILGIIFAIGLPLSIPIVVAVLNYRKRWRLMELYHVERMAAIERGMELPPLPLELIDGQSARRRTSLLPGLVWLFVGIAVIISLQSLARDQAMLGVVPVGVGLAYLIYYFVEGRKIELKQIAEQERKEQSGSRLEM